MILNAILSALGQISDPRFRRVIALGVGLTIGLLAIVYAIVFFLVQLLLPEAFTLPWIGEIRFVDDLLSWGSLVLMLFLSIFLMVPVASAFTGIFLDDVADAVEAEHYPTLPPAPRLGLAEGITEALTFLGVIIGANLLALIAYILLAPFAPIIFYALNGFLLGREYFRMIAVRRLGREGARQAFRRHIGAIWATGALMAVPLTIPLANLLVPVIGAAAFTHLYHSLESRG
ncbi:MAG: EI24 domain-containing protein [Paracoccaceae bacterium]|nr:EI24 domain-containing protein [Paracoccaceae bacterium]